MFVSDQWKDYEILDTSSGEKLERFGAYRLIRPDPQIIWDTQRDPALWNREIAARYERSSSGGGHWEINHLPKSWQIGYRDLVFQLKPMNFKHTGIFPEQAVNWDYCRGRIESAGRPVSVLNLFAYTGAASVACAKAGASVCHVDASRGMVDWAKENARANGLSDAPIRYIVDDCKKFVEREIRRGRRYDAIIMDPPSYGRGPSGEIWKLEESLCGFLRLCTQVLCDEPLFVLLNSYTTGLSPKVMEYLCGVSFEERFGGRCRAGELGLPVTKTGKILPCGATVIWER
ncbi:class I SAM-dependent methyltransferase [Feifania hominis]|uniref:Class I SAM-dependent methyltransferase n=1 Tax=Feifania hominis TaxID=2763660 RepID=A0A926DDR8_9FIRM|nr:class I SAM-dependent methyltransferase [Feifania hominis]MBC8535454.1 class I SAM-dependent methyltransferase [Feifania hominis]